MRSRYLFGVLMSFLCVFSFVGCINENDEGEKVTNYEEYTLIVASKKVPGVLFSSGSNVLADVYVVKKETSNEWIAFGGIKGFEYEPNYEYKIRISETNYLDYRKGDPAWTEYELLEVISKEEKESEGVPQNFIPEWYDKDL